MSEAIAGPEGETLEEVSRILDAEVTTSTYLSSGAANHIFRLDLDSGETAILKLSKVDWPDLFEREATALSHLESTFSIHVPEVLGFSREFLLLEDLGIENPEPGDEDWRDLGREIGELHGNTDSSFGWEDNNYIGIWEQKNPRSTDWVEFFYQNRVLCFLDSGNNRELLTAGHRKGIERIVRKIGDLVPAEEPSLCHGDLWKNNVYFSQTGTFSVIDPAIHYGLPEADLAMTQMYALFPDAFYEGYREAHELDAGWKERLPLYQLKELILMTAQFAHEDSLKRLNELIRMYA